MTRTRHTRAPVRQGMDYANRGCSNRFTPPFSAKNANRSLASSPFTLADRDLWAGYLFWRRLPRPLFRKFWRGWP